MAINSKYAGKKGALQIVNQNSAGESAALKIPVTAPKVKSKPLFVVEKLSITKAYVLPASKALLAAHKELPINGIVLLLPLVLSLLHG